MISIPEMDIRTEFTRTNDELIKINVFVSNHPFLDEMLRCRTSRLQKIYTQTKFHYVLIKTSDFSEQMTLFKVISTLFVKEKKKHNPAAMCVIRINKRGVADAFNSKQININIL